MRVLVADDDFLSRTDLVKLVEEQGYQVVGQARDGFEALEQARTLRPDVVVLDLRTPGCNGLEVTRLIRAELPEIGTVCVAAAPEDDELLETVGSEVDGYVPKNRLAEELARVLDALAEARRFDRVAAPARKEK